MLNSNKKYEIVPLRKLFTSSLEDLNTVIKENTQFLDLLNYRCEKLSKEEGHQLTNQIIRLQSLEEYFMELKAKVKREQQRGEEIITAR